MTLNNVQRAIWPSPELKVAIKWYVTIVKDTSATVVARLLMDMITSGNYKFSEDPFFLDC